MDFDSDFLNEIREAFYIEAAELIEQNEENFLHLEKNPHDNETLESIFRLAHNLKGSSKAVGFDSLSSFTHELENLLVKIKKGAVEPNAKIIDLLLSCNDMLKKCIESWKTGGADNIDFSSIEGELKNATEGKFLDEKSNVSDSHDTNDQYKNIGDILVDEKIATKEDVKKAASYQESKIGEILVDQGLIKEDDLKAALAKQKEMARAKGHKQDEFIRISLNKIDNLLNYFGEQVILQSALEYAKIDIVANADLVARTISQLSKITYDLQQTAIALRMLSIKSVFTKMERVVRDTAKDLNKKVDFITRGENNELDKTIIDSIIAPLTHMVRNSVDHGLEPSEERIANGKSEVGHVHLNAYHRGGFFYIEVEDDGKGLDRDKIFAKALKLGIVNEGATYSDTEIYNLIFSSGFSTKEVATGISGRGVGMDVVKTEISRLKGTTEITSTKGKGSKFTIRLPLTLAIFNGMIVKIAGSKFIIPNSDIEEAVSIDLNYARKIDYKNMIIKIKDDVMPLINLSQIIKSIIDIKSEDTKDAKSVLVVKHDGKKYALMVEDLVSQQRVVHKNLGSEIDGIPGVAGGTIMADGKVALILETSGLIEKYKNAA